MRPNFLYVGAHKAGSTWIEYALRSHPQIYVAGAKDVMFFDRAYERGMDWYLSQFAQAPATARAVGELSNDYFADRLYIERIARDLPDVRIMLSIREPVERMVSRFAYGRSIGDTAESDIVAFSRRPDVAVECDYFQSLSWIYEFFPRDRVLVLFYDDLQTDARAFARQIYGFLEVDESHEPENADRVVLGMQEMRYPLVTRPAMALSGLLRGAGLVGTVGWLKRQPLVNGLLFRRAARRPELSPEQRRALSAQYAPMLDRLETLLDRPLPPAWRAPMN